MLKSRAAKVPAGRGAGSLVSLAKVGWKEAPRFKLFPVRILDLIALLFFFTAIMGWKSVRGSVVCERGEGELGSLSDGLDGLREERVIYSNKLRRLPWLDGFGEGSREMWRPCRNGRYLIIALHSFRLSISGFSSLTLCFMESVRLRRIARLGMMRSSCSNNFSFLRLYF